MATRLLAVAVDDACEHDGPPEIAGRLQAQLDEQAPGLVSYVVAYEQGEPGLVYVQVETPDPVALQQATDPLDGAPPEDATASWLGEHRGTLSDDAVIVADFE